MSAQQARSPGFPRPAATIEKHRRAGKYTHPFGGMRRFAEDRARSSGWDVTCLNYDTSETRKAERAKLSDNLAELYKEEFIKINLEQGKGRPKANNISAAKKTVKMIAERVLLALEARATQVMFSEINQLRHATDTELKNLRQIAACGAENPMLTYEQIRNLVLQRLESQECHSDEFLPGEKLVKPEPAIPFDAVTQVSPPVMAELVDDDEASRAALKQALVEMRAEEISKGLQPTLISTKWVEQLTAAATELVQENFSKQYVNQSSSTASSPRLGIDGGNDTGGGGGCSRSGRDAGAGSTSSGGVVGQTGSQSSGRDEQNESGVLGCPHFRRKNRVMMACCGTFPVCRMCHFHDQSRIHDIRIEPVETMLCVMCGNVQRKSQFCTRCHVKFGEYYCDICGITDDPKDNYLRHCDKCNVCMPGLTFHCDMCKACFPAPFEEHFHYVHGGLNSQNGPSSQHYPGTLLNSSHAQVHAYEM